MCTIQADNIRSGIGAMGRKSLIVVPFRCWKKNRSLLHIVQWSKFTQKWKTPQYLLKSIPYARRALQGVDIHSAMGALGLKNLIVAPFRCWKKNRSLGTLRRGRNLHRKEKHHRISWNQSLTPGRRAHSKPMTFVLAWAPWSLGLFIGQGSAPRIRNIRMESPFLAGMCLKNPNKICWVLRGGKQRKHMLSACCLHVCKRYLNFQAPAIKWRAISHLFVWVLFRDKFTRGVRVCWESVSVRWGQKGKRTSKWRASSCSKYCCLHSIELTSYFCFFFQRTTTWSHSFAKKHPHACDHRQVGVKWRQRRETHKSRVSSCSHSFVLCIKLGALAAWVVPGFH